MWLKPSLFFAVSIHQTEGKTEIAQLLLENKADVNLQTESGQSGGPLQSLDGLLRGPTFPLPCWGSLDLSHLRGPPETEVTPPGALRTALIYASEKVLGPRGGLREAVCSSGPRWTFSETGFEVPRGLIVRLKSLAWMQSTLGNLMRAT